MGRRKTDAGLQITADFLAAITEDFAKNGAATLERVRVENPGAYCKLAADLTPKQAEQPESPFEAMSLEDLRRYCGEDDDCIIAKMVENLPRYDRLLKLAKKLAKAAYKRDPNPLNDIAAERAAESVPWRGKGNAVPA
jgi:hypothetical protein